MRAFSKIQIIGMGSASLGFEEHEVAQAMESDELAVAMTENEPAAAEISQDIADATVLEEKAVALEDLAEVADGIDAATATEVQLIDIAADTTLAGTADELEVFEVTPGQPVALENFTGRRVSTEGMKQMAKDIWDAIKALVARAWERLLKFWRRITDQVPGIVKRARAMATRADATRGKTLKDDGKTIKLGADGRKFIVDNKAPKSVADITGGLTTLSTVSDTCLTVLANRIKKVCESVSDKLKEFDIDDAVGSLTKLNTEAARVLAYATYPGAVAVTGDKRFSSDLKVGRSAHLPGNVAIFAQSLNMKDGSALGQSQLIRSCGFTMTASSEKEVDINDITITTLTPTDVSGLVDHIEKICASVKEFNTKHLRDLEKAADKAKTAAAAIAGQIKDDTKPDAVKHFNSACQYNVAVAKWSSSPFTSLTALALAVCNAAIGIGNKSLSQYK